MVKPTIHVRGRMRIYDTLEVSNNFPFFLPNIQNIVLKVSNLS